MTVDLLATLLTGIDSPASGSIERKRVVAEDQGNGAKSATGSGVALFDILKLVRGTTAHRNGGDLDRAHPPRGWGMILPASERRPDAVSPRSAGVTAARSHRRPRPRVRRRRRISGRRVRTGLSRAASRAAAAGRRRPGPRYRCCSSDLPRTFPFRIQFELGATRGVGRLAFDNLEDYGRYAERVASHESAKRLNAGRSPRSLTLSASDPIRPWAERLVATIDAGLPEPPLVQVQTPPATLATKEGVIQMLHAAWLPGITFLAGMDSSSDGGRRIKRAHRARWCAPTGRAPAATAAATSRPSRFSHPPTSTNRSTSPAGLSSPRRRSVRARRATRRSRLTSSAASRC